MVFVSLGRRNAAMPESLHSRVRFKIVKNRDTALAILKKLPPIALDMKIPKRNKRIESILPAIDVDAIYSLERNRYVQNRFLRDVFSRCLAKAPARKKGEMFVWIAHDWGRIGKGHKRTRQWGYELKNFEEAEITKFVDDHDRDGVSSWSKILAFYNLREHAIYDSRTSVALNVILDELKLPYRFYMPDTQNTEIPLVIKHVRQYVFENSTESVRNRWRYYREYIELLKDIEAAAPSGIDILEIEARLFAHAPALAAQYISKHGIIVPEETEEEKAKREERKKNRKPTKAKRKVKKVAVREPGHNW